ncbi:amidase [Amycolatopsis pithecellobii]|uniref:Amidase n=1 Tax=Amycolatopsis pithecellobii TaxID=664692 RepID=A0A6N7Z1G2_9PSEU|nr:amidase [Amycolatopsis pithecellobii]MTD55243.1 amidase [Amycolatopsis pithecellobii]
MSGWEFATLRDQVAALQAKTISAVELLELTIARIEKFDDKINAMVVRDFDRARAAAEQADAALARGEGAPLLGVPVAVKESFNIAGLPTTWGIPDAEGWEPAEDAVLVARVKAAGGVVIGKTNVPHTMQDWQSYNDIYGTTNNPWDVARSPGGSSGGSSAALAAGYVSLALGSDIGGSLRVPAHFCGVFGHKPSLTLLPGRGHVPPRTPALPAPPDLSVVGPMARSAADLTAATLLLAGPDEVDAVAYKLTLRPPRSMEFGGFRVLVIDSHPLLPTAAVIRDGFDRVAQALEKAGAAVARHSTLLPDLTQIAKTYVTLLTSRSGADMSPGAYRALQAAAADIPPDTDTLEATMRRGFVASHSDWIKADRVRIGLAERWRLLFEEFDVVLCPVTPTPAFRHDHSDRATRTIEIDGTTYPYDYQLVWPSVATLTGLPSTAVPIGRSPQGLPYGMQVVGPYLEDRTTLRFAELIERDFGGFSPPPGFA